MKINSREKLIKMKINQVLQKVAGEENSRQPLSGKSEPGAATQVVRNLKRLAYLAGFAGIVLCSSACMTEGYVTSEPTYMEYSRPPQPSNLHIWINGDYGWNRSSHTYVQRAGYWQRPVQGRTYKSGHWQTSSKGHSWAPGRWEKNKR